MLKTKKVKIPVILRMFFLSVFFINSALRPVFASGGKDLKEDLYTEYMSALNREQAGDTETAIEKYKKILAADPGQIPVISDLVRGLNKTGRSKEAIEYLQMIDRAQPAAGLDIELLRGETYLGARKYLRAIEAYKKALSVEPEAPAALLNLAILYSDLGEPATASEYLEKIVSGGKAGPEVINLLIGNYLESGDLAKAEKAGLDMVKEYPDNPSGYAALARVYEITGNLAAAITNHKNWLEREKDSMLIRIKLGSLYYASKDYDSAERYFLEAVTIFEKKPVETPEAREQIYWVLRYLVEISVIRKELDRGIQYAEKMLKDREARKVAYPLLAYLYALKGDSAGTEKKLRQAVREFPNVALFWFYLGRIQYDKGNYQKAIQYLSNVVRIEETDTESYMLIGFCYDRLKKTARALEAFERILELDPQNALAANYIGYTLAEKGESLDRAEELLNKALEKEPLSGPFLDSLGWILFKKGDYSGAEKHIRKALELYVDPVIIGHLGEVKEKQNDPAAARGYYLLAYEFGRDKDVLKKAKRINQVLPFEEYVRRYSEIAAAIPLSYAAEYNVTAVNEKGRVSLKMKARAVARGGENFFRMDLFDPAGNPYALVLSGGAEVQYYLFKEGGWVVSDGIGYELPKGLIETLFFGRLGNLTEDYKISAPGKKAYTGLAPFSAVDEKNGAVLEIFKTGSLSLRDDGSRFPLFSRVKITQKKTTLVLSLEKAENEVFGPEIFSAPEK